MSSHAYVACGGDVRNQAYIQGGFMPPKQKMTQHSKAKQKNLKQSEECTVRNDSDMAG